MAWRSWRERAVRDADQDPGEAARSSRANGAGPAPGLHPGRVVAYSWLMAAAAIGLLNQLHVDLHEHHDLPPIVHWLRDAALAVPLAAIAVVAAVLVVRARAAGSGRADGSPVASRLAWAALAAFLFALLSIPGIQLHGLLFGAEAEAGGWLEDALKDGGITLAVSLVALVPAALLLGPPWRAACSPDEDKSAQAPRPSRAAATGLSPSLVTAGSTHVGGDR